MTMEARNRVIAAFTEDPSITVFLMSLKAGGVALNLTAASHVMLMDPWCVPRHAYNNCIAAGHQPAQSGLISHAAARQA